MLVLEVLTERRVELASTRIDVAVQGGKAVLSGAFGGRRHAGDRLSFAHEWKKVTKADELRADLRAWFLGNAAGAGKRWQRPVVQERRWAVEPAI